MLQPITRSRDPGKPMRSATVDAQRFAIAIAFALHLLWNAFAFE